jgi:uncharacterized delta-60 repeat protein
LTPEGTLAKLALLKEQHGMALISISLPRMQSEPQMKKTQIGRSGPPGPGITWQLMVLTAVVVAFPAVSQTLDDLNPSLSFQASVVTIQPDGALLVAGYASGVYTNLVRLSPGGSMDPTFSGASNFRQGPGSVCCLAVQADGRVVVAGSIDGLNGLTCGGIGRLKGDGIADPTFVGSCDNQVYALAIDAEGRILLGGNFGALNGEPRSRLGRLNSDGGLDASFNPGGGEHVYTLVPQADGGILVGGMLGMLGGKACAGLGRLNADGTRDTGFAATANSSVYCCVAQPDGKIVIGGGFHEVSGQARFHIARLNPDGSLDSAFNPGTSGGSYGDVWTLALQTDGKILVGGDFTILGGQSRAYLGRLNADGSVDATFDPGASAWVLQLLLNQEGGVVACGHFTNLAGLARNGLGRLNNTEPATQHLAYNGSTITWLRGGTSAEVWRTTFDFSTNGTEWVSLGHGTRIEGGWRASAVSVPAGARIRARGFVNSGSWGGSSSYVETLTGGLMIVTEPQGLTNRAGTTASFSVSVSGSSPLSYQWLKNGEPLVEDERTTGTCAATLWLKDVLRKDEGGYSVIVTNSSGSITSIVAALGVVDPSVNISPANQKRIPGEEVTFNVVASGTGNLGYQWRKDGINVAGATAASLTLTNVQVAEAGYYDVIVSNAFGTYASAAGVLTVNGATPDAFNPTAYSWGAGSPINTMLVQPNGVIIAAGSVTRFEYLLVSGIGSLSGSSGYAWGYSSTDGEPYALAACGDGVLLGGSFNQVGGLPRRNIARLNQNVSVDSGFNPVVERPVRCLAVQPDGKVLVGWSQEALGALGILRLHADGSVDPGFNPILSGTRLGVVALQTDGKILVGGQYTTVNGEERTNLCRLNVDGTLDRTFAPGAGPVGNGVICLAVQADGKILVGGGFSNLGGERRSGSIGRLKADGTLDPSFCASAAGRVHSLAVQADGKIVVGGDFSTLCGVPRDHLGRLHPDGRLDAAFDPGVGAMSGVFPSISCLTIQPDGRILVAGCFGALAGMGRDNMGRLKNPDEANLSLTYDNRSIIWLRGGSSPEVWCTTFDVSTNGTDWVRLGEGRRISGGWRLDDISVPMDATIRARGFVAEGGDSGSSCWFTQAVLQVVPAPIILAEDERFGLHDGRFGFRIGGKGGWEVVVETSTNLVNWSSISTNTLGGIPFEFSDPESTMVKGRFYRVRMRQ